MSKKDINIMKDILTTTIDEFDDERYNKYIDTVKNLGIDRDEGIDTFHWKFIQPMRDEMIVRIDFYANKRNDHIRFLITNYEFIKNNFEKIIEKFEGWSGSTDKSVRIMGLILDYFKYNTKPDSSKIPSIVFQSFDQILEFFTSLEFMYYGKFDRYIMQINSILDRMANIRKLNNERDE